MFNIAFPSRNQMHVGVEDRLPGYSALIDTNIESFNR
jgi:hypothetical protein